MAAAQVSTRVPADADPLDLLVPAPPSRRRMVVKFAVALAVFAALVLVAASGLFPPRLGLDSSGGATWTNVTRSLQRIVVRVDIQNTGWVPLKVGNVDPAVPGLGRARWALARGARSDAPIANSHRPVTLQPGGLATLFLEYGNVDCARLDRSNDGVIGFDVTDALGIPWHIAFVPFRASYPNTVPGPVRPYPGGWPAAITGAVCHRGNTASYISVA